MIRTALRALTSVVLPNSCVSCEEPVERVAPDQLVCGVCRSRMRRVPAGCPRCQHPRPQLGPCRFCTEWDSGLKRVRSAVWHGPEARSIVHHLKYDGLPRLADLMAGVMARYTEPDPARLLVPVPLTAHRQSRRGYNQAERLARALGERWHLPVRPSILRRVRETTSQTNLSAKERMSNTQDAFEASAQLGAERVGVLLVDDVLTTGATLNACARALREAGWTAVYGATFSRALPEEVRILLT